MIRFKTGNIVDEDVEVLVNTVNCVGVMGRGIALQFKKAFPENFRAYAEACKLGEVQPGRVFLFETGRLTNPRYIINFPTKRHWRGRSRIDDIEAGLKALAEVVCQRGIRSIAVPALGSGLGGLEWSSVRQRIEVTLRDFDDLDAVVFEPDSAPETDRTVYNRQIPKMTAGRAALVGLMDRYLKGLLDPFVTLLEVHKLMYFMQVAGHPLRLKFTKGPYGPYAENLRHVLNAVEGHFISGYADGGDAPHKRLEIVPGIAQHAAEVLRHSPMTRKRFDRVTKLVSGFESAFGLELLATVHWVLEHENVASRDDLVERTHGWHERKKRFSPRQIGLAADALILEGWTERGASADRQKQSTLPKLLPQRKQGTRMDEKDEIIKEVKLVLNAIFEKTKKLEKIDGSEQELESTKWWTDQVLTALCAWGLKRGFWVGASGMKELERKYPGRVRSEFLYDLTCVKRDGDWLKRVSLVAESEWGDPQCIEYDFQKLLLARADVRLLVFNGNHFRTDYQSSEGKTSIESGGLEKLIKHIAECEQTKTGDTYLFAARLHENKNGKSVNHRFDYHRITA